MDPLDIVGKNSVAEVLGRLSIMPRRKKSEIEAIKAIVGRTPRNPDQILTREALTESATTVSSADSLVHRHFGILQSAIREIFKDEGQALSSAT